LPTVQTSEKNWFILAAYTVLAGIICQLFITVIKKRWRNKKTLKRVFILKFKKNVKALLIID